MLPCIHLFSILNIKKGQAIGTFKTYKGIYKPLNPGKYKGDPNLCVYRSLWERRFMQFCDTTETVLKWSSEEIIVPYRSPIDDKIHRYFVDFWVEALNKEGKPECMLVEIKPKSQTNKPLIKENKLTRGKMQQVKDWLINNAKWDAAKHFCEQRGWRFLILTEKEIFGKEKTING